MFMYPLLILSDSQTSPESARLARKDLPRAPWLAGGSRMVGVSPSMPRGTSRGWLGLAARSVC